MNLLNNVFCILNKIVIVALLGHTEKYKFVYKKQIPTPSNKP